MFFYGLLLYMQNKKTSSVKCSLSLQNISITERYNYHLFWNHHQNTTQSYFLQKSGSLNKNIKATIQQLDFKTNWIVTLRIIFISTSTGKKSWENYSLLSFQVSCTSEVLNTLQRSFVLKWSTLSKVTLWSKKQHFHTSFYCNPHTLRRCGITAKYLPLTNKCLIMKKHIINI